MTKRLAQQELEELHEGEMDAAHEMEKVLRFDVLNSVFQEWSKQAKHNPKAYLGGKHFETYTHNGIPYSASTSSFTDKDGMWSKIKLASNNFEYYPVATGRTVTLADLNGQWLLTNQHYLNSLPSIIKYAGDWCGRDFEIVAFYNRPRRLTVVKCKGKVNLMILFEDREPFTETSEMYCRI